MAIKTITLDNLTRAFHKAEAIFQKVAEAVKSVNGNLPDAEGDITVERVDYAGDLESTGSQTVTEEFIERSAGGARSINTGNAFLGSVMGNSVHTGVVPESVTMTVTAASSGITAAIDEDDFKEAALSPDTYIFSYSTGWNTSPALYGITVTGDPVSGDQITVAWIGENRGTITNAAPSTFVSTGWNLYNHTDGYAKVVKYSDEFGFKVAGAYTALQYSATLTGEKSAITVTGGAFTVPGDGYVWVTGGNDTTTEIWMTWEDWTESANGGVYAGYTNDEISVNGVMTTYFANGLCRVGNTRDEINLALGIVYVRIERMAYSAENLAAAIASGRDYDADTNWIYIVKAAEATHSVTLDGDYSANDHGIEFITGSTVPVMVRTSYGNSLRNKLERDVLTISQQTLDASQQAQVRSNMGLGTAATNNVANNVTTSAAGSVLDARQGRALNTLVKSLEVRSVSVTLPATFAAGESYNTNLKTIIDADLPSGKKCIGIIGYDSAGAFILMSQLRYSNSSYSFQCVNVSTATYSNKTAIVQYLCINS